MFSRFITQYHVAATSGAAGVFESSVASKPRGMQWEMIGLVLNIMPDQLNVISKC